MYVWTNARPFQAMVDLAEQNFVLAARLFQHALLFAVGMHLSIDGASVSFLVMTVGYVLHVLVARGCIAMPAKRIKLWLELMYLLGLADAWENRWNHGPEGTCLQTLKTVGRVTMVAVHVDSRLHIRGQAALNPKP